MNPRLLLRIAQIARHPPSWRVVVLGAVVILVVLLLAGIEALWGWPAALTPNRLPR